MTDKELQKLSRSELLELLLIQSREMDELKIRTEQLQQQLQNRQITLSQAGSIAEAALQLSGIFAAAQEAADLYLENVMTPDKLLEETQAQCDELLRHAHEDIRKVWEVVRQEIYNPRLDHTQWQKISEYIDTQLKCNEDTTK